MTTMQNRGWEAAIKKFISQKSWLPRLIIINLIVWLLISVVGQFLKLGQSGDIKTIIDFLAVPASTNILSNQPWSIITYMFTHQNFWHIAFNMLWLFWFGQIFLKYLTERQLLYTYFLGGVFGAFFFIVAYNSFPLFQDAFPEASAIGASASVMAIVVAISILKPNFTINLMLFGPLKIKYIALITLLMDFMSIASDNSGGHIAHIGGAFWGIIFAFWVKSQQKSQITINLDWLGNLWPKKRSNLKKVHTKRAVTDDEFNKQRVHNQKQIDEILDKISKSGYDSLTKAEKEILFQNSKK